VADCARSSVPTCKPRSVRFSTVRIESRNNYEEFRAGGVGHYRAMWESPDGTEKAFTLVPCATVSGQAGANGELALSTTVTLAGTDRTVEYSRRVEIDSEGTFSVVLAYPGEYEAEGGDATLTVTEADVREGTSLTASF